MSKFFDLLLPWPWGEINWITDSFISVIVVTFTILVAIFLWKTIRRSRLIDGLSKEVRKYKRPAQPSIKHNLKVQFERNQLAEVWQEFEDSLITRDVHENREVIYKTDDSSLFFGEDRLLDQHLNLRFWNSVPALLVGFGILGTFVGLVWGLIPFADINFEPTAETRTKIAEIQRAIKELLSGVSTAFVTSVWGMLTSLLFNGLEKWRIGRVSRAISNLQRGLDQLFTLTTQEAISFRQEDELGQQTAALKSFSTDLANKIKSAMTQGRQEIIQELHNAPEAFSSAMAERLTPSLDSLNTAVEELRRQREESSTDAIQRLVEEFHESLSGSTTAQLEGLAETVRSASAGLAALPVQLEDMITSVQEQIDQSRQLLSATSEEQTGQLQGLMEGMLNAFQRAVDLQQSSLSEATNQSIQALQSTITQLQESITSTASQNATESEAMTTRMRELLESSANQTGEQLNRRMADIEAVSNQSIQTLEAAITELQQALTSTLDTQQQAIGNITSQTSAAFTESTDRMRQLVDQSAGRLESILKAGEQSVSALLNQQGDQIRAINAQIANSQETLARGRDMLEQMNTTVTSVSQMIETTQTLSSQLMLGANRLETAGQQLTQAGQQLTQASQAFNQENKNYLAANRETIRQLNGMLNDTLEQFPEIRDELKDIFAEIQKGLSEYAETTRESINDYLTRLATQLASAVQSLDASIQEQRDNIEELNDRIDRLPSMSGNR